MVLVLIIVIAAFDQLLGCIDFILQVSTGLTMLDVFSVHYRKLEGPQGAYRTSGYRRISISSLRVKRANFYQFTMRTGNGGSMTGNCDESELGLARWVHFRPLASIGRFIRRSGKTAALDSPISRQATDKPAENSQRTLIDFIKFRLNILFSPASDC
jgi:hypothetical protein